MPTLERSNPLPLYYQLKEELKKQIRAGHLMPHTAIPSEPELVTNYQVSRATVRQALTELVHEGLLYRQHGKGTFVCEPRVQQTQSRSTLISLSDELRQRGKQPGGLLIKSELVRGSELIRQQLRLIDSEQAVRLERLRTADGTPIAYEIDYLPYPRAHSIYERAHDIAEGSLYAIMNSEGLSPYIAEQTLNGDRASAYEAELLRIEPNEPGIHFVATTFDQTGSPVAYTESFFPGTRYDFQVTLRVSK
ncbi:MAG TPA: GntR family transcriptional regulator [Ktedonobacteraceae bacterium]|nr:GntR family transcriptional regulator [Ktedonobacteraceae bacterium]